MNLYLTADRIGTPTGGGAVTYHEYKALESLGEETHPIDGARIPWTGPFKTDEAFASLMGRNGAPRLAHLYAGCFTETVKLLKSAGARVTYTAAAHDIHESRSEFESLGIPFEFPHLTVPDLWERYVSGYRLADVVVCPSALSAKLMTSYGCRDVRVIPHGCLVPEGAEPPPGRFTVGYLGQAGPDKGLRYLFGAWKRLGYRTLTLLVAGQNVEQAIPLWRRFGGGNVELTGFVKDVSDFYRRISVYCQPSVCEGFGIEVLEAMAHGRPVICSSGAGAADVVMEGAGKIVAPRDMEGLASAIEHYRNHPEEAASDGSRARENAKACAWESIRGRYASLWRSLA